MSYGGLSIPISLEYEAAAEAFARKMARIAGDVSGRPVTIEVETAETVRELAAVAAAADRVHDTLSRKSTADIDVTSAQRTAAELAEAYQASERSLADTVGRQKTAVSQLGTEAKKGAGSYIDLAKAVEQGQYQYRRLQQTGAEVERDLEEPITPKVDTSGAERQLHKLGDAAKEGSGGGGLLSGFVGGLGAGAGLGIFQELTDKVIGVGRAMIDGNAEMESYRASFEVLTGSAERTNKLMADLQLFGAETPFEFPELAQAANTLVALGSNADTVVDEMRMLGDISSAVKIPIGELSEIYAKMRTGGVIQAEELNQLAGRGIPVYKEFAKQLGVSESEVKKLGSEGKISFKNLETAFQNLTKQGGAFSGMMEKQAGTYSGMLSTFNDTVGSMLRDLGGPLFAVAKDILGKLGSILGGKEIQAAIGKLGKLFADVFGTVANVVSGLITPILSIITPIADAFLAILSPIISVVGVVLGVVSKLVTALVGPLQSLLGIFTAVFERGLGSALQLVASLLPPVIDAILPIVILFGDLLNVVSPLVIALNPGVLLFQILGPILKNLLPPITSIIASLVSLAVTLISAFLPVVNLIIPLIAEGIGLLASGLGTALGFIVGVVAKVAEVLVTGLVAAIQWLVQALTTAVRWVIDAGRAIGEFLAPYVSKLWEILKDLGSFIVENLVVYFETWWDVISTIAEFIADIFMGILGGLWDLLSSLGSFLVDVLSPAWNAVYDAISTVVSIITGALISAVRTAWEWLSRAYTAVRDFVAALFKTGEGATFFGRVLETVQSAIGRVVEFFSNFRAELAGVSAALAFTGQKVSEFFDVLFSADFLNAGRVFDGFWDGFVNAYTSGRDAAMKKTPPVKADIAGARAKGTAEGKAEVAAKTAETKKEEKKPEPKKEARKVDSLKFDTESEDKDLRLQEQRRALDAETDELRRALLQRKFDRINAEKDSQAEIRKLQQQADKATVDKKPVQGLNDKITALQQVLNGRLEEIDRDSLEKRQSLAEKYGKDYITDYNRFFQELEETYKAQADAITANDEISIRERGDKRMAALQAQQQRERINLIEALPEFQADSKKITDALAGGDLDPDDAREQLVALYDQYQEYTDRLRSLTTAQANERIELEQKTVDAIRNIRYAAMTEEEVARDRARLTNEEAYRSDLEIAGENLALRLRAKIRFINAEHSAEVELMRQTDVIFGASLTLRTSLYAAYNRGLSAEDRKRYEEGTAALNKKADEEKARLDKGELDYLAYTQALNDIDAARAELERLLAENSFDLWRDTLQGINDAAARTFRGIADQYSASADAALQAFMSMSAMSQDQLSELGLTADDVKGQFTTALTDSAIAFGAIVAEAAVNGENILKSAANTFLDVAAKLLEAQIPVWVASIWGTEVGKLGFAGIATAAALTAGLYGVVGLAKSALSGAKFERGGLVQGGEQHITINERGEEFVINHISTAANMGALEWINRNPGRKIEDYVLRKVSPAIVGGKGSDPLTHRNLAAAISQAQAPIVEELRELRNSFETQFESRSAIEHHFAPIEFDGDALTSHHEYTTTTALRNR